MRITCNQELLSRALGIVARAVPSRHHLPVLNNILLATDGGRLKLQATNLEIGITAWVDAQVEEAGSVTLPAALLSELVRQSPRERVSLRLQGESDVRYFCGSAQSTIKGIKPEEFPIVPTSAEDGVIVRLPGQMLREMIGRVAFAAATDITRPILTGVSMNLSSDDLTMCATDGFRMSKASAYLEGFDIQGSARIILPARALNELSRIIGDSDELIGVTITQDNNRAIFDADDVVLVTSLIEGVYPDVQRYIRPESDTITTVKPDELLKVVRRCNIFSKDESQVTRLRFYDDRLTVQGEGTDIGENEEELPMRSEGAGGKIALNAKYLMEALGTFEGDVLLESAGADKPVMLRPAKGNGFIQVLMPLLVKEKA